VSLIVGGSPPLLSSPIEEEIEEKRLMKKIILLVTIVYFFAVANVFAGENLRVQMATEPPAPNIGPDTDLVRTTLTVIGEAGQAVPGVFIKLLIHSPQRNPLISTDFPWVEDTPLMAYEGYLPDGILTFDYIYPIQGKYRMEVLAGLDPASLSAAGVLSLRLHENRKELKNILVFLALLLGFGVIAGAVIGRGAKARKLATACCVLFICGVMVQGRSPMVYAEHSHDHSHDAQQTAPIRETASGSGISIDFAMEPGAGKVGMLNTLTFTAKDPQGQWIPDTVFAIKIWHVEDDKPVFLTSLLGKNGQAKLNFQFFDGAEHEIRVTASNAKGQAELSRMVEVQALHPPLFVKIKTLLYFVGMVLIGILAGFRWQQDVRLKPA
jgi:hypothetical protein